MEALLPCLSFDISSNVSSRPPDVVPVERYPSTPDPASVSSRSSLRQRVLRLGSLVQHRRTRSLTRRRAMSPDMYHFVHNARGVRRPVTRQRGEGSRRRAVHPGIWRLTESKLHGLVPVLFESALGLICPMIGMGSLLSVSLISTNLKRYKVGETSETVITRSTSPCKRT